MSISNRDRFLGICHFERPGDLYISDWFWPSALEEWVKQGAPKQIVPEVQEQEHMWLGSGFINDYFQFGSRYRVGVASQQPKLDSEIKRINHLLISPLAWVLVPNYEPRIISEDKRTITFLDGAGRTLKVFRDNPYNMPMYLDWPVKDRASWNEYKKRLDPNTPERWPADWNAHVQEMNKLVRRTRYR